MPAPWTASLAPGVVVPNPTLPVKDELAKDVRVSLPLDKMSPPVMVSPIELAKPAASIPPSAVVVALFLNFKVPVNIELPSTTKLFCMLASPWTDRSVPGVSVAMPTLPSHTIKSLPDCPRTSSVDVAMRDEVVVVA